MPRKTPTRQKQRDPLTVVRKGVDTWLAQVSRYRLALDDGSTYALNIVDMCDVTNLLIDEEARAGRCLSHDQLDALENKIAALLNDDGRKLLAKLTEAYTAHESIATDAGYMFGCEVGRRMLAGGARC